MRGIDVRRTVLVEHPAERMFDLIEGAEHYPEFLPWCAGASIVERNDAVVVADISVNVHGVRFEFRTRNPKRRPEWLAIELERGPFRRLRGEWRLVPLGASGCKIVFEFGYDLDLAIAGRLAAPVFDRIVNTLVDAFVTRADAIQPAGNAPPAGAGGAAPPSGPPAESGASPAAGSNPFDSGATDDD